jgi:glucose/arabinose dehydrogenase/PKD repeat protein
MARALRFVIVGFVLALGWTPVASAQTTTVNFDTPPPPESLNGVFQGIDFGAGQWQVSGPYNVDPTNNIYFAGATGTSRTFRFSPAPRVLNSLRVYTTTQGTLTVADDTGQTLTRTVTTGSLQLVTTGWTRSATTVTVTFTAGWALGVDDITYSTASSGGGGGSAGFRRSVVASGLVEPTTIEFTPDGRLFIAERGGRILVVQNGALLSTPLIQIDVNTDFGERGLVGLAVDPAFETNGFLYAYYTTREPRNRVGRFTVVGNTASPASERVIWQNPDLAAQFHHGGTLRFGPDGNLYIATGDQERGSIAQSFSSQHGKILRIRRDGSIPPDNPFLGVPGAQAPIWALGLRNPFRFVIDSLTGEMWIGDVGGNTDTSREEINRGMAGANYGWPNQEGPACFVSSCAEYTFPVYFYRHNDPAYFTNQIQASITLGPVYRGTMFPAEYQGSLFFGDYANRWIRRLTFDGSGGVTGDPVFDPPPGAGTIVDLKVGPDGALYYVNIGIPWSGASDPPAVYRIEYTSGANQVPVAVASASVTRGPAPLTVQFTGSGSSDPDGGPQPLSFNWAFGDGGTSTQANPRYVYTRPGLFAARLTVRDGAEASTSAPIQIRVGSPPTATITQPGGASAYRAGDVITFAGTATDPDGPLGDAAFSWRVVLRHADHVHPFVGPLNGIRSGTFAIPVTGHSPENTFYEISLTVTDPDGLTDTRSVTVSPVTSTLRIDTVPSGIPVFLDGAPEPTPRAYASVPGFRHAIEAQSSFTLRGTTYVFGSWSDGGTRAHTYIAPEGGGSITATYNTASTETTTVNFDTPPPPGSLNGVFQGIDFGTGQWQWTGAYDINPTNHIYFANATGTSRTFSFSPAPRVLNSLRVYSPRPGTLTLSDDTGQTLSYAVTTGSLQLVTTGWTRPATTVTVSFTQGWALGVDDITYSTAAGTPPPTPTTAVNFDNPPPPGASLNGVFQGIDFGTGQWFWTGPYNVNPTNHIYFANSTGTSRTFRFSPAPRVLTSVRVYSPRPGTLTLSDDTGQTLSYAVTTGSLQLVTTGWTQPATTVTVSFTEGWALGVDDVTYSTAP